MVIGCTVKVLGKGLYRKVLESHALVVTDCHMDFYDEIYLNTGVLRDIDGKDETVCVAFPDGKYYWLYKFAVIPV